MQPQCHIQNFGKIRRFATEIFYGGSNQTMVLRGVCVCVPGQDIEKSSAMWKFFAIQDKG